MEMSLAAHHSGRLLARRSRRREFINPAQGRQARQREVRPKHGAMSWGEGRSGDASRANGQAGKLDACACKGAEFEPGCGAHRCVQALRLASSER